MMLAATINWTEVLISGVPAMIAAIGSAIAVVIGAANRRNLKTPSGDSIGSVVERAHDLAAVAVAAQGGVMGQHAQRATERLGSEMLPPTGTP